MSYIKVATVQVSPASWQRISGILSVPPKSEKGVVQRAVLYFGGPPPHVNFMVAAVRLVEETDQSGNVLRNADFASVHNGQPEFWTGVGDARIYIHPKITCEGKSACVATDRQQAFGGLGQNVLGAVRLGRRYRFVANLRLAPEMPAESKHKINIKLQYKSIDSKSFSYILIASVSGIKPESWTSVKGALNMPPAGHVTPLKSATLYFGNLPTDVSFMVANVSLTDDEPQIEDTPVKMPTECTDDACAPVFISYQWDIQDKVKALRDKLEKCGLACWMDIGQMGGGDSLYAQIDKGIRASKVVVCCITSKYAKSENCQREITLADCLKKPVIPLLMDKTVQWPPAGQLSMILAKLLYIDMTGAEKGYDFPPMKIQELMSEIKERL